MALDVTIGFGDVDADIVFSDDIDRLNFTALPAGAVLGRVRNRLTVPPLRALGEGGQDITGECFEIKAGNLMLRRDVMPSMLTLNERIIRQDCLCYLMERLAY